MDKLIEVLQSIKDEAKEVKACTIVVKMNDGYTHKLITGDNWGDFYIEEIY